MRLHDPHRNRGFEHFCKMYKPHIRPDGQLRRLRQAFQIDARYEEEFKLLCPWLRRAQQEWAQQIVDQLMAYEGIKSTFGVNDMAILRKLYSRHAVLFSTGRIDDEYLDSLEDVALFFLFHEVRSVWLAGAYGRLVDQTVDYLFDVSKSRRKAPIQRLMRCFCKGMTLELSQIQRVFICYERHVLAVVMGHDAEDFRPGMESALRDSLFEITEHGSVLSRRFFAAIEERAPELERLLPLSSEARTALFVDAATHCVGVLTDPSSHTPEIMRFGRFLAGAPLRAEHRKIIETALIATLKQAFGARWSEDLEGAWIALYRKVSLIAMDARDEAEAEKAEASEDGAETAA